VERVKESPVIHAGNTPRGLNNIATPVFRTVSLLEQALRLINRGLKFWTHTFNYLWGLNVLSVGGPKNGTVDLPDRNFANHRDSC